jgi:putative transcriptional regulator
MTDPTLAPTLLLSMPQLDDPNFARSVVLLCQHDTEGAFGLVLNRPVTTTARIVPQDDPDAATEQEVEVWIGGPVDPARGWLLLAENLGDGIEVSPGLYLSASRDLLRRVLQSRSLADRCRFLVGYAGWGPRQLDSEPAASAWLTVPVDKGLLFETPVDTMWEVAIRGLGIEPHSLALGPGVH